MWQTTSLAAEVTAQSEQHRADAFNRAHALAQEAERAVSAIRDSGRRVRAGYQAEDVARAQRADDSQRFVPDDLEPAPTGAGLPGPIGTGPISAGPTRADLTADRASGTGTGTGTHTGTSTGTHTDPESAEPQELPTRWLT